MCWPEAEDAQPHQWTRHRECASASSPASLPRAIIQFAMRAMMMERPQDPLVPREIRELGPGPGPVLVRVAACPVCHADLHVLDGELPDPKLPLILGHELVGRVLTLGAEVRGLKARHCVGIPWLAWTCDECGFCRGGQVIEKPSSIGKSTPVACRASSLARNRTAAATSSGSANP